MRIIVSRPQLTNSMAFYLGPGSKAQGLHRDDRCHYTRHPARYETDNGIKFAGTKSYKANGVTNVVPGSNHWDDHRKPNPEEAVPAELEKGDALIWLGSTYHGAGFNSTKDEMSPPPGGTYNSRVVSPGREAVFSLPSGGC
ncbi:uncharacterized protein BP01DRAFT_387937 [Aspergillus saccharolyticus JOP 1030-1]|uniref:Phytanoyl-CoA dioxygenase family protein n=1 Tax=Aspergillus saccharolyticus JOP 1030-1 TaxID=1450539 RepID=A0A318ZZT5_9EURO|nr:hypothetical protein BP01DRAFT_387937 [Aspergillus saccharolyticus JOP 1030-1]PYH49783.1 hypothetical protein BP01DRAFT_387937 [Aspergillus saccharolyticus JOP 1030-1]